MTRRNPLWRLLALLFALSLIAAACGDDDDDEEASGDDTEEPADEADEPADEPASSDCPADTEGDGQLKLGTLLPETGSLAFLGPPEFAGVDLAAQEINEAGGVLDKDVTVTDGDSGDTSTDIANQTADRLLGESVDAIIGAASSGVTFTVIDKITGACTIQFSPANTAPDLSTYDDNGLYFRTAPSDVLQGKALADVILRDGLDKVAVVARDDDYGTGLMDIVKAELVRNGLPAEQVQTLTYASAEDAKPDFGATAQEIKRFAPSGVLIVGFGESAAVIKALDAAGVNLHE